MSKSLTAQQIYDRYHAHSFLQEHMLRTAYLAKLIIQNWNPNGPALDEDLIISGLLIHDVGNIVKNQMPADHPQAEEVRKQSEIYSKKYGVEDHFATLNILYEIGASRELMNFVGNKIFILNERTAALDDFNLKIAAYADQRVAFDSIMELKERLDEAKERSIGKSYASMNHPRVELMIEAACEIEKQVLEFTNLPNLQEINKIVEENKDSLRDYKIKFDI